MYKRQSLNSPRFEREEEEDKEDKERLGREQEHVLGSCRAKTVAFTVETEKEALAIFERWLKRDPLRPRKVVDSSSSSSAAAKAAGGGGGGATVSKTLIPYWKFADVSFRVKYKAKVGFSGRGRKDGGGERESNADDDVEWKEIEEWREFNGGEAVRYDFEKDAAARQLSLIHI